MTIEQKEGDWILEGGGGSLVRIHMYNDTMEVSVRENVIVATVTEARELRDWLTRRLNESEDV